MSARTRAERLRIVGHGTALRVPGIPDYIAAQFGSTRKWKALKRQQVRDALRAYEKLRDGSAFFPCADGKYDTTMDDIQKGLIDIKIRLSRNVWGR